MISGLFWSSTLQTYFGASYLMTEACVIEIKTFNLQIKQMDFKSLLGTNVDSLHSDTVNGY